MRSVSELERLRNFRDLGGYATRSGRMVKKGLIYRSGGIHLWTEDHADWVRTELAPRTLIDLRGPLEAEAFPIPTEAIGAAYLNAPIPPNRPETIDTELPSLLESYLAMARLSGASIAKVLDALADPAQLPAVVFCAAGKDRTGVAIALLLGALNVEPDQIVDDYALSGVVEPRSLGEGYAAHFAALPTDYQRSDPETMRSFIAAFKEEHISIRTFVLRCGLEPTRLAELERTLLSDEVGEYQPTRPVT